MAHYHVTARPRADRLDELRGVLEKKGILGLEPFGRSLTKSLVHARSLPDGRAVWEEEDYCSPPLAMEREAVLDDYFDDLSIRAVREGEAWAEIDGLPRLFPGLDP